MVALEEIVSVQLAVTWQGTIRIRGSRVSLDSIIEHLKLDAINEQYSLSY